MFHLSLSDTKFENASRINGNRVVRVERIYLFENMYLLKLNMKPPISSADRAVGFLHKWWNPIAFMLNLKTRYEWTADPIKVKFNLLEG